MRAATSEGQRSPSHLTQGRHTRASATLLALLALAAAPPAEAQPPDARPTVSTEDWKSGYNGLAMLCRLNGIHVHDSVSSWGSVPSSRSLMIVLGNSHRRLPNLMQYVNDGGALLLATDRGNFTFLPWGVAVRRGPVQVDPNFGFRGFGDCPLADVMAEDDAAYPGRHWMRSGWRRLATNRAGVLDVAPLSTDIKLTPFARFSGIDRLFGVAIESDAPQAVILADQSIFTNQMLICEDNAAFAQQALQWLAAGRRTDVLIVANQFVITPQQPNDVLLPPPDPRDVMEAMRHLPPEALLEFANLVVAAAEDEEVINDLLADIMDAIPEHTLMRVVIVSLSVLLGLWLLHRLLYRRTDSGSIADASGRGPQVRAAIERRQAAIVLLDQLRSDVAGGALATWEQVLAGVSGGAAKAFRRDIRHTLNQVYRKSLGSWTSRRLASLEKAVQQWRRLHAEGDLLCKL